MMRERDIATSRLARFALVPAIALATAAQGQASGSVQDYQLPPSQPSPNAAGPVDTDHPVATPTRPAPEPTLTAAPVITLPAPTATQPALPSSAAPTPRAEQHAPSQSAESSVPKPTTAPPATTAPARVPAPSPLAPVPTVSPAFSSEPALASAKASSFWPWVEAGVAILMLTSGILLWRRRRKTDERAEDDAAPARTPPPEAQPRPPATLAPSAPAESPVEPALTPAVGLRPLELELEARYLSRAMVNATLAYRLTLTNRNVAVVGPLRIVGDITSAHASLSAQQQLLLDGSALPPLHEVRVLAPGETAVLTGELRLPIASILPIHNGASRVFVPLARFRVEAGNDILALRVFVVGQAGERPGGALRPFVLDRGPGVERGLDQRELELPV